jgi:hypothetical protein
MERERTKRVLWKAAMAILGVIVAALSWILNITGLWNPATSIPGVILGLAIAIVSIYQRFYGYEEKIDGFEDSRPKLIPRTRAGIFPANYLGTTTTTTTTITTITTHNPYVLNNFKVVGNKPEYEWLEDTVENEANKCWFALIDFYNEPIEPTEKSVAREVSAHIIYYDKDCKPRIKDEGISGRWWTNEEVAFSDKPRQELERTNIFPATQGVTLAVACMGVKESAIYGYNNESHEDKNFKKREFSLGLGSYYIHVILAGINLKRTDFWFSVWHDKHSGKLMIETINKPKCMK